MIEQEPVTLSPRQTQILAALAHGRTIAQIARDVGIAQNTVKVHMSRMYLLLGAANAAQAVAMGIGGGLIAADQPPRLVERAATATCCRNCGSPRGAGGKRFIIDRCETCYEYLRSMQVERPSRLWVGDHAATGERATEPAPDECFPYEPRYGSGVR